VNPTNRHIVSIENKIEQAMIKNNNQQPDYTRSQASRGFNNTQQSSSTVNSIRTQFHNAMTERDIILAERLLQQVERSMPNSRIYQNLNLEYQQLVLQIDSEKLYETLILEALDKQDVVKAEHYLNKLKEMSQDDSHYLELKKQFAQQVEANKKSHIILTASVDENSVFINGVNKGSTPLSLNLPKGDYLVELKKQGYPLQRMQLALYGDVNHHFKLTDGFAIGIALENPAAGIEMMAIESGCFTMGSPSSEDGHESGERLHNVCIKKDFWMGKYEITQQQWQAVMQDNPAYFDDCGPKCPIENIEFHEIQYYLKKLSNQTGHRYRLPTEAEWEYAARAGHTTSFSFGSCMQPQVANFNTEYQYNQCTASEQDYRDATIKIGSFTANVWGLHDMHGNVREWTCSAYDNHYQGAEKYCHQKNNSVLSNEGVAQYSVRGGSWQDRQAYARSAYRDKEFPNTNNKRIGFRVVREK
jgi:formylglycine-generating enzyme required for sulfatase activity